MNELWRIYIKQEEGKVSIVSINEEQYLKVSGMFESNMQERGMQLAYSGLTDSLFKAIGLALHNAGLR